jgi:hypothetical protein
MTGVRYLHWDGQSPLEIPLDLTSESILVIAERQVLRPDQNRVAVQLVELGIKSACTWGIDCEDWHDTIDWVDIERTLGQDDPPVLMTTWHASEPLEDAMWYFKFVAFDAAEPDRPLANPLIFHIAVEPRASDLQKAYTALSSKISDTQ